MAQLQVTVNKLNRRKSPVLDFADKTNIVEVVSKGFTFESVAQIENSLGKWHGDKNGVWVWEKALANEIPPQINYNRLIQNIPDEWKATKGEGITVAIMDTGLSNSFKSNFNVIKGYNSLTEIEDEFEDNFGHGTFVTGIIASNNNTKIGGIAPNVKLIIIKISNDLFFNTNRAAKGLKWLDEICPIRPDILNISADFPASTNREFFNSKFNSLSQKGTLIFAAAEDDSRLFGNDLFFPSSEINVHAVGKLNSQLANSGTLNTKLDFISGDFTFNSVNDFGHNKGSSFTVATMTGIAALALPYYRSQEIHLTPKEYISSELKNFSPTSFDDSFKIFKL